MTLRGDRATVKSLPNDAPLMEKNRTIQKITPARTSQGRFSGADSQIRTGDLILTKDALYLLSYISMPRTGNDDIIHNLFWFGKGEFTFFLKSQLQNPHTHAALDFPGRFVVS